MSSKIGLVFEAEDKASGVIESVGNNTSKAMADSQKAAEAATKAHNEMVKSTREVALGFNQVLSSATNLYFSYDNLEKVALRSDKANLAVQKSSEAVEKAQKALSDATLKYGADSAEAKNATDALAIAEEALRIKTETATIASDEVNESRTKFALTVVPTVISGIDGVSRITENWTKATKEGSLAHQAMGVVQGLLSGQITLTSIAEGVATGATTALSGAMAFLAANPIILVIAAVAALVIGLKWLYDNNEQVRAGIDNLIAVMQGAFSNVLNVIGGLLDWLGKTVIQPLIGFLGTLWNTVTNNPILAALFGPITTIAFLIGHWSEVTTALGTVWTNIMNSVKSAWDTYVAPLVGIITGFAQTIAGVFQTLFGWVVGGSSWTDMCKGILGLWNSVVAPIQGLAQAFANALGGIFSALSRVLGGIWSGISSTASSVWSGITTSVSGLVQGLSTTLSTTWNSVSSNLGTTWNAIKTNASTIWSGITGVVSGAASTISGIVSGILSSVSSAWSAVNKLASNAASTVSSAISSAQKAAGDVVSGVSNAVSNTVSNVVSGVSSAVNNVVTTVSNAAQVAAIPKTQYTSTGAPVGAVYNSSGQIRDVYQTGMTDKIFTRPTLALFGEAGAERVSIRSPNEPGDSGSLTFSPTFHINTGPIYGFQGADDFIDYIYDKFSQKIRREMRGKAGNWGI